MNIYRCSALCLFQKVKFLTCLAALLPQLPFDDHNTEIQSDHQLESKCPSSETSGEFPVQTAQRASNTREDVSALETSQVTHVEVLQSLCKALQTEMEKLEKLKTESLEQHEDMVCHPNSSFSAKSGLKLSELA